MGAIENAKETIVRFLDGDTPGPVPPGPGPSPTPGGGGGSSWWTSQTGDTLSIVLLAIIAVAAVVMGVFFYKKWRESIGKYGVYTKPQGISAIASSVVSSNFIAKICVFSITACLAVLMCTGISHAAENLGLADFAYANATTSIDTQDAALNEEDIQIDAADYINVYVYDNGTITVDQTGYLANAGTDTIEFLNLAIAKTDSAGDLSGIKWKVSDKSGNVLYNQEAGAKNPPFNAVTLPATGEKFLYDFGFDEGLTFEKASSLIGKDVLKISYVCGTNRLPETPSFTGMGILQAAFAGKVDATLATKVSFIKQDITQYRNEHKDTIRAEADLSASKAGNIMAFVVDDDMSNSYKIDIVSPNKIYCSSNSMSRFFRSFRNLTDIKFDNLDLSTNTDFSEMFMFAGRVDGIMTIKPTKADSENGLIKVGANSNFSQMFYNCNASVDLSNINISNVSCMDEMFKDFCYDVPEKDLKRITITLGSETNPFAIPDGCSVHGMFARCNYDLNASSENTDSVVEQIKLNKTKSIAGLFYNYRGLYRYDTTKTFGLDVSKLDPENIGKIEDMTELFAFTFDGKSDSTITFGESFPAAQNCTGMFKGGDSYALDLSKVNFSKTNNMSHMFDGYGGINIFDPEKKITWADSVTTADNLDLSYMYRDACVVTDIFKHIAPAKVMSMEGMFKGYGTTLLLPLDPLKVEFPSGFKVKDNCSVSRMFSYGECNVDLTNFDTSNITDFSYMFEAFGYVDPLDSYKPWYSIKYPESGLKTGENASFSHMFDMAQLPVVDISKLDTSKVKDLSGMFTDLGQVFDISQAIIAPMATKIVDSSTSRTFAANADMSYMFDGYRKLYNENLLDISKWNLSTVQNFEGMFRGVNVSLNITKIDYVQDTSHYVNIKFPTTTTAEDANMSYMFDHAFLVTDNADAPSDDQPGMLTLKFSGISTANVTNMSHMFEYTLHKFAISELGKEEKRHYHNATIDVSSMDISKVKDMSFMFHYALPSSFDLSSQMGLCGTLVLFGSSKTPVAGCDSEFMFSGVGAKEIPIKDFNTSNCGNMNYFFSSYGSVAYPGKIDLSNFTIANATSVKGMFYNSYFNFGEGASVDIDLTSWDTSNVKDFGYLFFGLKCDSLNISTWNFDKAESMEGMFMGFGYDPLTDIAVSKIYFPTSTWTPGKTSANGCSMKLAFSMCLADVDLSKVNVGHVNDMYGTFMGYGCSLNQIIALLKQFIPPAPEDGQLTDNSVLASVLNGDSSSADKIVNGLTDPFWSKYNEGLDAALKGVDKVSEDASKYASYAEYLAAPETTDDYSTDDLEQVAFSKDDLAGLIEELNFDEVSSSKYTSEISGTMNNSFYGYTDEIKAELADVISHCELPDFYALMDLPEDYNPAQSNFMVPSFTITFPTPSKNKGELPFAPAKDLTGQLCSMRMMFLLCNCFNIDVEGIYPIPDFSGFDTSKVNDMSFMFTGFFFGFDFGLMGDEVEKMTMDLSSFDTTNVTDMMMMFAFMGFKEEYASSSVNALEGNFYLTDIKLGSNFKFKDGCDTRFMFTWCRTNTIDLSAMNTTGNLKSTRFMFSMGGANKIILNGWDSSNVSDMSYMFSLYGVPSAFIDNAKIPVIESGKIVKLESWSPTIDFGGSKSTDKKFVIPENAAIKGMFFAPYFGSLDLKGVDVSNRKSLDHLFELSLCSLLRTVHGDSTKDTFIDISNWNMSNVKSYRYMFTGASYMNVNFPTKWAIAENADLSHMFFGAAVGQPIKSGSSKIKLDISCMQLENAGNLKGMFEFFTPLDLPTDYKDSMIEFGQQTINCADLSHMFELCGMGVDLSGVKVTAAKDLDRMFALFGLGNRVKFSEGFKYDPLPTFYTTRLLLPEADNEDEDKKPFETVQGATADFMFAASLVLNEDETPNADRYEMPGNVDMAFLNTTNIRRMEGMFMLSQTSFDLTTLDTTNVDSVKMLFMGYGAIKAFIKSGKKIDDNAKQITYPILTFPASTSSKIKLKANCDVKYMFTLANIPTIVSDTPSLTKLDAIDVSELKNFDCMFALGLGMFNYDLSGWSFNKAESLNFTFAGYGLVPKISVSKASIMLSYCVTPQPKLPTYASPSASSVNAVGTFLGATFFGVSDKTTTSSLDLSSWDFSKISWAYGMFAGYNMNLSIAGYGVSAVPTATVKLPASTSKPFKFAEGADLTSLFAFMNADVDISGFDPNKAISLNSMFAFYGTSQNSKDYSKKVLHDWKITWPNTLLIPEGCSVRQMFFGYQADTLNLSSLNTQNVTDLTRMFMACDVMSINGLKFDTTKVVDMKEAFTLASAMELDLSAWKFNAVKDMRFMFAGFGSNSNHYWADDYDPLIKFPETTMQTAPFCDATGMFLSLNMRTINLYGFNVDNILYADYMFAFSDELTSINVKEGTDWYKDGSTYMSGDGMFYGCDALIGSNNTKYSAAHISFNYARVDTEDKPGYFASTHMLRQFDDEVEKSIFKEVDGEGFSDDVISKVEAVKFIAGDPSLITEGEDISSVKDKSVLAVLSDDKKTISVISKGIVYADELSLKCMFDGFTSLSSIDLGRLNTIGAVTTYAMFRGCANFTSLDASKLKTTNVYDMSEMFKGFGANLSDGASLTLFTDKENFNSTRVFNYSSMFEEAKIKDLNLSKFDICAFYDEIPSEVDLSCMFKNYRANTIVFPNKDKGFSPSCVYETKTIYDSMFEGSSFEVLDISGFNLVGKGESCSSSANAMFRDCTKLKRINVSEDFRHDYFNPETSSDMFRGCSNLTGENGTTISKVLADTDFMEQTEYTEEDVLSAKFAFVDGEASHRGSSKQYGYFSAHNIMSSDSFTKTMELLKKLDNTVNEISFIRDAKVEYKKLTYYLNGSSDNSIIMYIVGLTDNTPVGNIEEIKSSNLNLIISSSSSTKVMLEAELFSLKALQIKHINFENVVFGPSKPDDFVALFKDDDQLESINWPNKEACFEHLIYQWVFDDMFNGCSSLVSLDVSNWFYNRGINKVNIFSAGRMFANCTSLTTIYCKPGEAWNIENEETLQSVFNGCQALESVYGFKWSEHSSETGQFARDDNPQVPGERGFFSSGSVLAESSDLIYNDGLLEERLNREDIWSSAVSEISIVSNAPGDGEFEKKVSLSDPDIPDKNTIWAYVSSKYYEEQEETYYSVKISCDPANPNRKIYCRPNSMNSFFCGFDQVNNIRIESAKEDKSSILDTSGATNMSYMFSFLGYASGNVAVDGIQFLDTSNVTDFSYMFNYARIQRLDLATHGTGQESSMFDTSKATNLSHMFDNFGIDYDWTAITYDRYTSELILNDKQTEGHHVFKAAPNCDASYMFYYCHVKILDLSAWEFTNIVNYDYMFAHSGVYTLNIFNDPEVANSDKFKDCATALAKAIDNKDNAAIDKAFTEAMESGAPLGRSKMFPGEIYFNNDVDWGSVVGKASMEGMFMNCLYGEQGTEEEKNYGIDLSGMKTDKVTNMSEMFAYTPMFTEVKVGEGFSTASCNNMYAMFKFCGSLNSTGKFGYGDDYTFPVITFNKGCVVESMFQGANIPVDLSKSVSKDVPKGESALNAIKDYTRMFCDYGFYAITAIIGGHPNLLNLKLVDDGQTWTPMPGASMQEMFRGCKANVDLSKLDVKNVENFDAMFMSFGNTDQLDLLGFEPGTVTWPATWLTDTTHDVNMSCMFKGYKGADNLNSLFNPNPEAADVTFRTSNVTNMGEMFRGAKVKSLDLRKFDTSKVIDMSYMFSSELLRPSYVTEISLPDNFINENSVVRNISYIFGSAIVQNEYLRTINCNTDWNDVIAKLVEKKKVVFTDGIFAGCISLVGNIDKATQTVYDPDFVGLEFARPGYIDKDGKTLHRGYFTGTHVEPKVVKAVVPDNAQVETDAAEDTEENAEEEVVEPSVEPEVKPVIDPLVEDEDVEIAIEGPLDNIDLVFADDYELDNMGTVATTFFQNIFNQLFKMILSLAL